jgi:divalent metal cation (Fe/Co/Zn/Cd) transporter
MLLWGVSLDGILGTLISALIIKAGVEMLASPVGELLGSRVSPELVAEIKKEVMAYDGVHGVYDIILHNYGPEVMIGSLHVSVDDTLTAQDIHGLSRKITLQMFRDHAIVMTVGVYAVATGENQRAEIQSLVLRTLTARKDLDQIHGFFYDEKENLVTVDVVPDLSVHDEPALSREITRDLEALLPGKTVLVTVDHNYSE